MFHYLAPLVLPNSIIRPVQHSECNPPGRNVNNVRSCYQPVPHLPLPSFVLVSSQLGDLSSLESSQELSTVLDWAQQADMMTGVVSTARGK